MYNNKILNTFKTSLYIIKNYFINIYIYMSDRLGEHYNRYSKPTFSEYNNNQYNQQNYNQVYSNESNAQYSISQEPDIEYEEHVHYVSISSKDRDIVAYPNVNHYAVQFPNEFKNIHSIELIQGIIPDQNNVQNEPYLLLKIDEIQDVMVSNDKDIANSFAILQLATPTKANTFIQIDRRIHEYTVKYYQTPKAYLSKMTVTILGSDGIPFDFGTDTPSPPNKMYQNTFIFKIVTLEKKRRQLNHRNVY
jgi:hypothetical protein